MTTPQTQENTFFCSKKFDARYPLRKQHSKMNSHELETIVINTLTKKTERLMSLKEKLEKFGLMAHYNLLIKQIQELPTTIAAGKRMGFDVAKEETPEPAPRDPRDDRLSACRDKPVPEFVLPLQHIERGLAYLEQTVRNCEGYSFNADEEFILSIPGSLNSEQLASFVEEDLKAIAPLKDAAEKAGLMEHYTVLEKQVREYPMSVRVAEQEGHKNRLVYAYRNATHHILNGRYYLQQSIRMLANSSGAQAS